MLSKKSPLQPIFAPISSIKGIGPRYAALLANLTGPLIRDLLWHLPAGIIDRRNQPKIAELSKFHGQTVTLDVLVVKHIKSGRRGLPFKVTVQDATGTMDIVFFKGKEQFWQKSLPIATQKIISGKVEFFKNTAQMVHPDYIGNPQDVNAIRGIEAVYPLTYGVTNKFLRKMTAIALGVVSKMQPWPDWIDANLCKTRNWPDWGDAMIAVHNPTQESDFSPAQPARQRLAYDEILSHQLALTLVRNIQRAKRTNRNIKPDFTLRRKLLDALPFQLTDAQLQTLDEIDADMQSNQPMLRLLQGDVGSGKTIVAMLAMINAIESGGQAAIMAPTEILARQHEHTIRPLAEKIGLKTVTLTGRDKGKSRAELIRQIKDGEAQIVIGTHAILEDNIEFRRLGCVVIDEQHRFGVEQRLGLMHKGEMVDTLVMTATPIPRSLFLALYGDLDTSRITQKPPGRKPIDTRTIATDRIDEVIDGLARAVAEGRQIYWVCPLVAESEILDLAAAEERYEKLKKIFGAKTGIVHGKMKAADKDRVMQSFAKDEIKILVSTTVIEVGVNVPNASIMVIDHAERFGLSQLHQLRGRVGRGEKQSTCLLLFSANLSQTAKSRLAIMRETEDGFRIAEEDLKLRGAGEILGTRQSGLPDFKLANFFAHQDLFKIAQADVKLILEKDPHLMNSRGQSLRILLELFSRDQAIEYLGSG